MIWAIAFGLVGGIIVGLSVIDFSKKIADKMPDNNVVSRWADRQWEKNKHRHVKQDYSNWTMEKSLERHREC